MTINLSFIAFVRLKAVAVGFLKIVKGHRKRQPLVLHVVEEQSQGLRPTHFEVSQNSELVGMVDGRIATLKTGGRVLREVGDKVQHQESS